MILLIDAYNLLHFIVPSPTKEQGDRVRQWLITTLAAYQRAKSEKITEIRLAFDAGPFRHRYREVIRGVVVMYAGTASSADHVLMAWAAEERSRCVVVTHDREVQQAAHAVDATVMECAAFWPLVTEVLRNRAALVPESGNHIERYEDGDEIDEELELLMLGGELLRKPEDADTDTPAPRGRTKSKKERAGARLVQKLR